MVFFLLLCTITRAQRLVAPYEGNYASIFHGFNNGGIIFYAGVALYYKCLHWGV